MLLYLFCRVGKSAISLQIAKEITNTNHIFILTAFPSAKDSFKKYTVNHTEMLGYDFFDKDNLSEEALMESEKCIVFLSTNALRVKTDLEDEDDNSDKAEDENVIYERIDLLRKAGQFDILIVDETHNGISSPATNRLISKAKEVLGVEYVIHNSATPFNDFKSNRFSREQTIQVDFLTILQNNWVNFPKLSIVSLPFYEDEELTVKTLKSVKGKHKLLFWSATVKSCKDFVTKHKNYFESNGIKIEYVDNLQGSTVEDKINTFQAENNKTITVSCGKGHTGCTYPKCDCVILARDLSSAERLIQVMSRCLTPDDDKEEVYFYTIGTENEYKAVSELKRNNNAANNHQTTEAFEDALKTGKLSIRSASFKEGEDLEEYEAPLEEILREVAEFSASLDSIEKDINVDVANVTIEDVINFSTYTESGISKATRSLLTLFKDQGKRKVKEVQSKDAEELCEQLKKRINEKGTKKDKGKVEEYTLKELLAAWFMNVLKSLNTWLLCQEIEKFEDIVEYVTKENQLSDKEKDTFAILVSNNENLLKNFIIAHNEVFIKFESKTLYEKSNMNLRKFLSKDFDIAVGDVGGGYPGELAKRIVKMASIDWDKENLKVATYDDIYLEATKTILDNYNINDTSLYYVCSNRKVGKLLRKAYTIPLDHILYLNCDKDELYYIDEENSVFHYNIDMSFDLIIANPPYGKSSSLSKRIVTKMLESEVAKEIIYLSPRNTYKDSKILAHVAVYQDVENYFTDAAIDRLAITRIVPGTINRYTYENISLNKKQTELLSAIRNYNSQHDAHFHVVDVNCFSKKWNLQLKDTNSQIQLSGNLKSIADKRLADLVKNFQCFFKTVWTPSNGVHISDSHDIRYNLNNVFDEKVKEGWFKGHGGDLFVFKDRISRENFNKWWYSCKELYGKERKGLTNYILRMLCEAISTSAGVNSFYDYLPHVDWSKSWTDQEILKEIGLPEDFLEEKK